MKQKEVKTKRKLKGEVIKIVDEYTVKVEVEEKSAHPLYKKIMKSHKKYLIDLQGNKVEVGEKVEIEEMRPVSKRKKFKLVKKAK